MPKEVVKEIDYSGVSILESNGTFRVDKAEFKKLEFAKSYIDLFTKNEKAPEKVRDMVSPTDPREHGREFADVTNSPIVDMLEQEISHDVDRKPQREARPISVSKKPKTSLGGVTRQ